jgi:hypothetical protein
MARPQPLGNGPAVIEARLGDVGDIYLLPPVLAHITDIEQIPIE